MREETSQRAMWTRGQGHGNRNEKSGDYFRDYILKREQHRQAGVREYWIVDEMEQRVMLLRLTAAGAYREAKPRKGVLHSQVVPGFWLRPEWLWQQPRPKKTMVLAEILKT